MPEPNTVNKALIIPNTGDLPGSWGTAAMNPNFQAIDGMLGGFTAITLSSATTIALSAPSGSLTPGAGPTQQQNAMLRFSGALAGTATIQFSVPGFFIIDNQCTGTTFPLVLGPAVGTGNQIGIPPGVKSHVFFDGTGMDFVNAPLPGSAIDLHGVTAVPVWMKACTVQYALIKDGQTYSTANFSALAAVLGSTFGGNGATTFGVPDERTRMRIPVDTNGPGSFSNRVTAGGSGINGTTMGASGGDQLAQAHSHGVTDPGHSHTLPQPTTTNGIAGPNLSFFETNSTGAGNQSTNNATTGISINSSLNGGSQNMPPTIVSFLALIKT